MVNRYLGALAAVVFVAAPLSAQRAIVLNVNGGGYDHLVNLNNSGAATADFNAGYNLGASAGVEITQYVAVHADFTFANALARGSSSFAGANINRFFYGAHIEGRYPTESGLTPFAFLGGGGVTVHQPSGGTVPDFTKPAGMFGAGFGYLIPRSSVEVFAEGKGLVYQWKEVGFDKTLCDVTYSIGLAYHIKM